MMFSCVEAFKASLVMLFLLAAATAQDNTTMVDPGEVMNITPGEIMTLPPETVPAGGNPQVTPDPESQEGTQGPTTQVLTQVLGQTFAPAPTPIPAAAVETDESPTSAPGSGATDILASTFKVQIAAVVGLAGVVMAML
ncbi:expressed unknown protein [Seminavis robusta]|uniref:Uncharacterized protein n=1 Tax=Seminavis robusta TaxID=568900 RepID=A0A9N8F057_9STRA|nr:expressed unknown protein [Seminavis robusta]CAB9530252.1 expressed unknown protein [Seminavis robusta]|eukprot:Sro2401_g326310.1 n/a (139) ;mRNA; f:12548-12964